MSTTHTDPKPPVQRNYLITCAGLGIVLLLKTVVSGSLFVATGDREGKCVEIKIDASNAGTQLRSRDVKATVRDLSAAGLPIAGTEQMALVTVEEASDRQPAVGADASDVGCSRDDPSLDAPEASPSADAPDADVREDALAVAIRPSPSPHALDDIRKDALAVASRPSPSAHAADADALAVASRSPPAEDRDALALVRRNRPITRSHAFEFEDGIDLRGRLPPQPDYMPPFRQPSSSRELQRRGFSPTTGELLSSQQQPHRAPVAGPSRNAYASSSTAPPPVPAMRSPRKRRASEITADDSAGEGESSASNDPRKRAKGTPRKFRKRQE
ncbi:hypothetical protein B0H15DRAFT_951705 [Mycena belliarum]|uniref:Uncharacterized protein n=1 Tax=Mycena belliarum TaxID=1033014 RepID=A0AAD6U0L4_9AGAR|nr:hypothetical protein B0H15DRAFT_951705 [Mycena belliae]